MDKDNVGSPKERNRKAPAGTGKAIGDAKPKADSKAEEAEDKARQESNDVVRDALATSAAAMTLGGLH